MAKRLRVIGFTLAGTVLLAIPVSHNLWGAPPAGNKQLICHVDETTGTGKVLEIAKQAIPAHCAHHPQDFTNLPVGTVKGAACTRPAMGAVCAVAP